MSIALLAFDEAVQHYNAQKGSFLAFSSLVISRRLTDYMRKQGRLNKEIVYSELSEYRHRTDEIGGRTQRRRRITSYNVCYTKLLRFHFRNRCSLMTLAIVGASAILN